MTQKIKKLIKDLKFNKDITDLSPYGTDKHDYWEFHYNITGFYKDNYFSLGIRKKEFLYMEIDTNVTDKPEELNEFLQTITDLKFDVI